jgi:hypothetical protein
MGRTVTGTMYLPCPACGVVRTMRVRLDQYSIGKAQHTTCWPCAMRERWERPSRGPGNAAELADEIKFIGGTPEEAARRLGTTLGAIARRFQRAGMYEQARPFDRATKAARRRRAA